MLKEKYGANHIDFCKGSSNCLVSVEPKRIIVKHFMENK